MSIINNITNLFSKKSITEQKEVVQGQISFHVERHKPTGDTIIARGSCGGSSGGGTEC